MKSTLSKKGQVTIPKPLREKLGLGPGQILEFEVKKGTLVGRKASKTGDPVDSVSGILGHLKIDVDKELELMRGPAWGPKDAPRAKRR